MTLIGRAERTLEIPIREFYDELYDFLEPGQLLEGRANDFLQRFWDMARPDTFRATRAGLP